MQLEEQFEDVASTTCVVILYISLELTLGMIVKRLIDKNMHELSSCKSLVNQDHLATEVGRCENTCHTKEGLSASACCDCFFLPPPPLIPQVSLPSIFNVLLQIMSV